MLIDNMGLDEQWGGYLVNNPRGITKYELSGHEADVISWKITGNVGGEYYLDKARGPLNEGRLYAERHGFHRPSPPSNLWKTLARWTDYIPQSGKYVNNIGPQTRYPAPERILNYHGENWVAVTVWAWEANGAKLDAFELVHTTPVLTSMSEVESVELPKYSPQNGVY